MNPLALLCIKDYALIALGIVCAVLTVALSICRADINTERANFRAFKSEVSAAGEKAKAEKLTREKGWEDEIKNSNSQRDAALASLRDSERSRRSRVPITPAATDGGDKICFSQKALSAAVERYRGRILGLVAEGDAAQIDAQALIRAWPRGPEKP